MQEAQYNERHIRHSLGLHGADLPKWLHVSMLCLAGSTSFDDAAASFAQPCNEKLVTTEKKTYRTGGRRHHPTSNAHFLPGHLTVAHTSKSMEPVTPLGAAAAILGLAGKAWDLGRYVHNVYQGAKTVDTRIKNLSSEVQSLASTCDLVHAGLACVLTGAESEKHSRPYDHDGTLEKGINGQVAQCETTIEELGEIVERLWPRKKKFVDRTVRELKDIRARIKSHTDALHTALLVLSFKVAHISPGHTLSQLPEDLADLRGSILRIEARLEHAPVHEDTIEDKTPNLVECARDTLRSGMTLFYESIAGSTVGVDSVIGDEQAAINNKTVEEWISAERNWLEHHDAGFTPPEHFAEVDTHASGHSKSVASSEGGSDCDSDDEEVEFAITAFRAGVSDFVKQNWQSAAGYLVVSKKATMELPVSRGKLDLLFELQNCIAVCWFHLGLIDNAESELRELLQLEPVFDKHRTKQCDAYHMLARIYIRQNKLDAAKDVCDRTWKARWRLQGKQHEAYLKSVALMSRICELLGETVDSEVYLLMIPDDQRNKFTANMRNIRPSNVDKAAPSAPIKTQVSSADAMEPRNAPLARDPDCTQNPPIPTAVSKEKVLSTPSVQEPFGDSCLTTNPSRMSIPKPSTMGHDLQRDRTAQSESPNTISVLDATLRDRSTKSTCASQDRTAIQGTRRAASPAADVEGLRGSAPISTGKELAPPSTTKKASEIRPVLPKSVEALLEKSDQKKGNTALDKAILLDDTDAVNALLRFQPSSRVHHWLSRGKPLELAVRRAKNFESIPLDNVQTLLDHGADLAMQCLDWDNRKVTIKDIALGSNRDDLIALVKSHAFKMSSRQKE